MPSVFYKCERKKALGEGAVSRRGLGPLAERVIHHHVIETRPRFVGIQFTFRHKPHERFSRFDRGAILDGQIMLSAELVEHLPHNDHLP